MNRLRTLEIFFAVIEAGSFNKAAKSLAVTPQAVSHAIRILERELGVALFYRSTRTNRLTAEGQFFAEQTLPAYRSIDAAWEKVHDLGGSAEGTIRIAATPPVGIELLIPVIESFQAKFPRVQFDLVLDDRFTDLVENGIDLAFRTGFAPEGNVIVRDLLRMQLIICCSPGFARRHRLPTKIEDLDNLPCTGCRQLSSGRVLPWEFQIDDQVVTRVIEPTIVTNDTRVETEAVLSGLAIGQLDSINAARHLRSGALIPVLPQLVSDRYRVVLYYPADAYQAVRTRNFITHAYELLVGGDRVYFSASKLEELARSAEHVTVAD